MFAQPRLGVDGPVVLCIMDGVGLGGGGTDDAVASARTPNLDRYLSLPHLALRAHGLAVGLPSDADMGNSEVGHNALGAGRVFDQGAKLVNAAIASGAAFQTDLWSELVGCGTLHLMGLLSDGNVHSHIDHVDALVARAVADGVRRIRLHVLTDGRDVAARSALTWVPAMEARLAALADQGVDARIASGGGRMRITMDRYDADWEMVARGWRCHVHGEGRPFASATAAIETLYADDPDVDDQWLPAFVVTEDGQPVGRIGDGDAVLFFNFRGDRSIEISRAFEDDTLDTFDRGERPSVLFAGMMQYDGDLHVPSRFLVQPPVIEGTLGELLAAAGKRSFACAETQKFGHVTYFFNGNRSGYIDASLERYVEVPSDVRPFEQAPWMKAAEVVDAVIAALESGSFDHLRLNLANGDMVGHSGHLEATRIAVECVDLQLGRLEKAVRAAGGVLLVTADHGNADEMWLRAKGEVLIGPTGQPLSRTSHTLNRVPFILLDPSGARTITPGVDEGIASVATTLAELCGLSAPEGWAPSLVQLA